MTVERVEFLVEEPSMEAFLRGILPGILEEIAFEIYPSQCKEELLKHLPERLEGYSKWLPETWRIVVVVDRDSDGCLDLKAQLEGYAKSAGLISRSRAGVQPYIVLNRIAVEELEAWYFGDWQAVRSAYSRVPSNIPRKAKYRDSDNIQGGTWEAFERLLKRKGYFEGGLRKIEAAKKISQHIVPERNQSPSFRMLHWALLELPAV